jgi:hypothetical protein
MEEPRAHVVPDEYGSIQEAVNAAQDRDTVRVRPGTYTGEGNIRISVLYKSIVLIGAGAGESVIDCQGVSAADPGPVITLLSPGPGSVVKGLTIRNARAREADGGALRCAGGSLWIEDCEFENCIAKEGGGMSFLDSRVQLIGVTCRGCVAIAGGGASARQSMVYGTGLRLLDNQAIDGGGLLVDRSVFLADGNIVVVGNEAQQAGGGIAASECVVELIGAILAQNHASQEGGAILVGEEGTFHAGSVTITDNAAGPGGGGGVKVHAGGTATFKQTILWGNCAGLEGGQLHVEPFAVARLYCSAIDTTGVVVDENGSLRRSGEQVFSDPRMCGAVGCETRGPVAYSLSADSPCMVPGSPCGVPIGGLGFCDK